MTLEQALFEYLSTFVGLANLIGFRIYPIVMPETDTLPAVVFQGIGEPREYSLSGVSGLAHPRYQFSCYANTFLEAKKVALQVKAAFDAFALPGMMSGIRICDISVEEQPHMYDGQTRIHHIPVDAVIWYNE